MAGKQVQELDCGTFAESTASGVTLVDFWAPWCGPCRMLGPVLEETAVELGDSARVSKVNVDDCPDVAARFGVRSIPALFVLKNGKVVESMVGLQSKSALMKAVERHL